MKVYSAIFLLFLFVISSSQQFLVYMHYLVNKDYITEFLCINKEKPELACDGKCFLADQIKKFNEENQGRDFPVVEKLEIKLFVDINWTTFINDLYILPPLITRYSLIDSEFQKPVFHPPDLS
ncbi:MAG: hypothetical protein AAF502_00610 [Bacteroidota bacterium]